MNLIEQAQDFVYKLLKDKLSDSFIYHNFNHTSDVVKAVKILSEKEKCTDEEIEILTVAAWFHDTGYIYGFENHEDNSVTVAAEFLKIKQKGRNIVFQLLHFLL